MSFMIRGNDYLAKNPGFKLVGRDDDLKKLSSILMRKNANSVLLVGANGVGATALCMGLQAAKSDPNAAFDIVSKRLFWLDTDALFSSGDNEQINASFQKELATLARTPDSILIVEDTRDFMEGARNSNNAHFINALTQAVKTNKTQVILEVHDQNLEFVLKWHSDIRESYTMMDLQEPTGEALSSIVHGIAEGLVKHHGIRISEEAIKTAIEITTKYNTGDEKAQPDRAVTLLDRALASYRLNAHNTPPKLAALQAQLSRNNLSGDEKVLLQAQIDEVRAEWARDQTEIKRLYSLQREGEIAVMNLEEELDDVLRKEKERIEAGEAPEAPKSRIAAFSSIAQRGGVESEATTKIRNRIHALQAEVLNNRREFEKITQEINANLELDRICVLQEFSRVSGISVNKLNEDEKEILRNLEATLNSRIFGQGHITQHVANAIKTARIGRRKKDQPQASMLFLGPSGVGKTEAAKALTFSLMGDAKALTRFDMSEYMEKHAVAKLIGAPPGYEGFEAGGILTNLMRRNRNRVLLFDEIEKAHPDVFNIFLQVLSDGRLTDNVGRTVSFDESIIIMTTNIGQPHFLNEDLHFEAARELAMRDLDQTYRPEFLNRFAGRENIMCFNRLDIPSIEKIVRREFNGLDAAYAVDGCHAVISDDVITAFCKDHYDPRVGARGLPGYIEKNLEPIIANRILETGGQGVFTINYDGQKKAFDVSFTGEREAA